MGSGGNWKFKQKLRNKQVEWPTGPLTGFGSNETPTWVEAWVVQRTTGASQRTFQKTWSGGYSKWTADKRGLWQGKLRKGPAVGIALLSSHDSIANDDYYYWWVDQIKLT